MFFKVSDLLGGVLKRVGWDGVGWGWVRELDTQRCTDGSVQVPPSAKPRKPDVQVCLSAQLVSMQLRLFM